MLVNAEQLASKAAEVERHMRQSASQPMTADELFEQTVSWVYGQIMVCHPQITKADVRKRLKSNRGLA